MVPFAIFLTIVAILSPIQCQDLNDETPTSDRRKFVDIKISTVKKPKLGWWPFPSFFRNAEVVEAPTLFELAPLDKYPIWKIHKYKGIQLKPVPVLNPVPYPPPAGIPDSEYGPPQITGYEAPAPIFSHDGGVAVGESNDEAEENLATEVETQSNGNGLGSLTSFLGRGTFQSFIPTFGPKKNILSKIKDLKTWKIQTKSNLVPVEKKSKFSFLPNFLKGPSAIVPQRVPIPSVPLSEYPVNYPSYSSYPIAGPYALPTQDPLPYVVQQPYVPYQNLPKTYVSFGPYAVADPRGSRNAAASDPKPVYVKPDENATTQQTQTLPESKRQQKLQPLSQEKSKELDKKVQA